jgi:hypothetical protein
MQLSGFTLFQTGKGWQLSLRPQGEEGWSVHAGFPDEKAQEILSVVSKLVPKMPVEPPPTLRGQLALRPRRERVRLDD